MNGHTIPNTPIAVDTWQIKDTQQSRLFFLSHAHADHTCGLTSTWKHTIYTSILTAKIIIHKLKINPSLVKPLVTREPYIIPLDESKKEYMTVTLFDANHCPGAVMFLFQGYFGTILYTGDFRYDSFMVDNIKEVCNGAIDQIYLDNTYCNDKFEFCSKEKAMDEVLNIVSCHLDEYDIVIGLRYLGKEEILLEIAKQFRVYIALNEAKLELFKILGLPNYFTTDFESTKIRIVQFELITKKVLELWNRKKPTIAILPTCLYTGKRNPYKEDRNIFVVPYSDHSSFSELKEFVTEMFPKRIHSIVKRDSITTSVFNKMLNPEPLKKLIVPQSVQKYMKRGNFVDLKNLVVQKRFYNISSSNAKARGVIFQTTPEKYQQQSEIETESERHNIKSVKLSSGLDDSGGDEVYLSCDTATQTKCLPDTNLSSSFASPTISTIMCLESGDADNSDIDERFVNSKLNKSPEIIIRETPNKDVEERLNSKRKSTPHPLNQVNKKSRQMFGDDTEEGTSVCVDTLMSSETCKSEHFPKSRRKTCLSFSPIYDKADCSVYTNIDQLPLKSKEPREKYVFIDNTRKEADGKSKMQSMFTRQDKNVETFMYGKREYEAIRLAVFQSMKQWMKPTKNGNEIGKSKEEAKQEIIEERRERIKKLENEGKFCEAADLHILLDSELNQ